MIAGVADLSNFWQAEAVSREEEEKVARHQANRILLSSREAEQGAARGWRELRVLTRFTRGQQSPVSAALALECGQDELSERCVEFATDPGRLPLRDCWLCPATNPLVKDARRVAEERADKRDALHARLTGRLRVAMSYSTNQEEAQRAGLSTEAWERFCEVEDNACPCLDTEYREGWNER